MSSGRWNLTRLPGTARSQASVDADHAAAEPDEAGTIRTPSWLTEPEDRSWRERLVPERFRGAMVDPGRRGVRAMVVVGIVAVVVAGVVAFRERPVAAAVAPLPALGSTTATATRAADDPLTHGGVPVAAPTPQPPTPTELVISVVGLVHRSGLVRLPDGARVADAVAAAGGSRDGADLTGLNLAQRLLDGDQVLVGPPGPVSGPPQLGSTTISSGGRSGAPASGSGQPAGPGSSPAQAKPGSANTTVDLNTATEAELDALPGVGPVTAAAIIAWRTSNGRFTSVDQLAEVDGIGPARLARLRDVVKV
ncbi:ComEA family DNA-binding protein [Nocardia callitridis]